MSLKRVPRLFLLLAAVCIAGALAARGNKERKPGVQQSTTSATTATTAPSRTELAIHHEEDQHGTFISTDKATCVDIPSEMKLCHGIGYTQMRLPNLVQHETLAEVTQQSKSWAPLLSTRCHADAQLFLCSLFSPVCLDEPVWPCRSLCERVKLGCEGRMAAHGFTWPAMLNCSRLPSGDDLCIEPQHDRPRTSGRAGDASGKTKPLPVYNLTVQSRPAGLLISWSLPSPPSAAESPSSPGTAQISTTVAAVAPLSLSVEYQTVGPWLPLPGRLAGNVTSYLFRSASQGVTYRFRVLSHAGQASPLGTGVPSRAVEYYAPGNTTCPACSQQGGTFEDLRTNYCAADFAAKIKPRDTVLSGLDLKITAAKKFKVYKRPANSLSKRHPTFYLENAASCNCYDLAISSSKGDASQYIVMGKQGANKRLTLTYIVKFDPLSSAARRAVRSLVAGDLCRPGQTTPSTDLKTAGKNRLQMAGKRGSPKAEHRENRKERKEERKQAKKEDRRMARKAERRMRKKLTKEEKNKEIKPTRSTTTNEMNERTGEESNFQTNKRRMNKENGKRRKENREQAAELHNEASS